MISVDRRCEAQRLLENDHGEVGDKIDVSNSDPNPIVFVKIEDNCWDEARSVTWIFGSSIERWYCVTKKRPSRVFTLTSESQAMPTATHSLKRPRSLDENGHGYPYAEPRSEAARFQNSEGKRYVTPLNMYPPVWL